MERYDVIVVGGGTGNGTALAAADAGNDVALVEPGPLGGTCLNRGCNPSKMLIQHANVLDTIRDAEEYRIDADVTGVDYAGIVGTVTGTLSGLAKRKAAAFRRRDDVTLVREAVEFVDDRTVSTGTRELTADTVVVAAGSRPIHPGFIDGIDDVEYLTSADAVRLEDRPDELVVIGGGYIACELGYFFEAMGTDVTLVEMEETLLPRESGELAAAFTEIARERHDVRAGYAAQAIEERDERVVVTAETEDGTAIEVGGDAALVAVGRRPNADRLNVAAGGIETDDDGFVVTDEYLRTSAEGVWAHGDVADNYMFKHSGDYESEVVVDNAVHGRDRRIDFSGMGHAIFTHPPVGSMGATESDLDGNDYVIGRERFENVAMARARRIDRGFVKVLAAKDGEILGCHVLGDRAPDLIHEAIVAKRTGADVREVADAIHVHPALSKVMKYAFENAAEKVE